MGHRIYLYNQEFETNESLHSYLGEWKYEVPLLLIPLFSQNIYSKNKLIFANKEQGIIQIRYFLDLLAAHYQLTYKNIFTEPISKLFEFLEQLPYDTFVLDASDVFNMNEAPKKEQAKDLVAEIVSKWRIINAAIENQDVSYLDVLLENTGYNSFLEILQTDWINYGLGYFEVSDFFKNNVTIYEENGLFGLLDFQNNVLTPAIYNEIFNWNYQGVALVIKNGLYGYINYSGAELVPCIYTDALDAFEFENNCFAQVWMKDKTGLINCLINSVLLETVFDEIDKISYEFLNVLHNGFWKVFSLESQSFVLLENSEPFGFDFNTNLFYAKQKQTSLHKFYNSKGVYLGDFVFDSLFTIANQYIYAKPNKYLSKIQVINGDGNVVISDIDQIVILDNFETFAYKKLQKWQLFSTKTNQHLLQNIVIDQFIINDLKFFFPDFWIIKSDNKMALFDAKSNSLIIDFTENIIKIEVINSNFLKIEKTKSYVYFNLETLSFSEGFDYLLPSFFTPTDLDFDKILCFGFKNNFFYLILEDDQKILIPEREYGNAEHFKYNLQGNDLKFWNSFFTKWKVTKGQNFELLFDKKRINEIALNYCENNDFENAIRLFTHLANLGDTNSMVELGLLYTNPDAGSFYNVDKGIEWNEAAADLDNAFAWNNLGYFFQNEIGYDFDLKKIIFAYEKAAELGNGLAYSNLGDLYYFGELVTQDYDTAFNYYKKAEEFRHYNFDKMAEILYQQNNFKELLVYLKEDSNNEFSDIYYGILYDYGYGVKQNSKKAIAYYEKANQNLVYLTATSRLLYYFGENETFKNKSKYDKWLRFAKDNELEI